MPKYQMKTESADVALATVMVDIEAQIAKLQAYVAATKAETANWAIAGSAGYVREQLHNALCHIGLEEDGDY